MLSSVVINEVLRDWCDECKLPYTHVMFKRKSNENTVQIFTDHPGILIGKAGSIIDKYQKILQEKSDKHKCTEKVYIELVETERVMSREEEDAYLDAVMWKLGMCDEEI